jgi:hypothetical protein
MKTTPLLCSALSLVAATLVGCGESGSSTPSTPPATNAGASVVDSAAAAVTKTVNEVSAEVTKKVDAALAEAQSFLGQAKFQDALGSLNGLSSLTLSAEQQQTVGAMKAKIETAMKAAGQAVDSAKLAAGEVTTQVNAAVAKAQTLLKEAKFQDALTSLKGLSDLKLSAEQTKLVDDLKAQIQAAMAAAQGAGSDAAKAASDLFKKK